MLPATVNLLHLPMVNPRQLCTKGECFFFVAFLRFNCFILFDAALTEADLIFNDSAGKNYLIRDVLGAGDCTLLALLHNPNFHAPVSGADGLRTAMFAFAIGERHDQCSSVYSLVGGRNTLSFDSYVSQVLQQGFWVGTVFFIWVTMCYGIEIRSHYFNANRIPEFSSTCDFLRKHLPDVFANVPNDRTPVHVFFIVTMT
jgi:hypothetical protein